METIEPVFRKNMICLICGIFVKPKMPIESLTLTLTLTLALKP